MQYLYNLMLYRICICIFMYNAYTIFCMLTIKLNVRAMDALDIQMNDIIIFGIVYQTLTKC